MCGGGGDEHGDGGALVLAVDGGYGCGWGRGAGGDRGDSDGFAHEVDDAGIDAGGDEDGIAVVGSVDGELDGGLVGGDVDDGEGVGWSEAKPEDKKEQGAEKSRRVHGSPPVFLLAGALVYI